MTYDIRSRKVDVEYNLKEMAEKIQILKQTTAELKSISGGIQTVERNVDRILTFIKILEHNVSSVL